MSKTAKFSIMSVLVVMAVVTAIGIFTMSSDSSNSAAQRFGVASVRAAAPIGHIGNGQAATAIEKAGNADKYVYALFYREDNDQLTKARGLVEAARKKIERKSEVVEISVADQSEREVVTKYGANRAQLPLILVLAPNGAIMGGFPVMRLAEYTPLAEAVGCKASEQTLKALQSKNMVALCMQNKKTTDNAGAMQGVEEFVQDPKFAQTTAVVMVDPSDPVAARFVSQLGLDPKSTVATTALLAPPGTVIGTFQGATPKDRLVSAVQAAAAPKSGGCCPPGSGKSCGPTGGATSTSKTALTPEQVKAQQSELQNQATVKNATSDKSPAATAPTAKPIEPKKKQGN